MSNSRVTIIILNWNGWKDTVECLESLFQINYNNFIIIVVDNASDDDSINQIRQYCCGNKKINSKFFKYSNYNKPIELFEYYEWELEKHNTLNFGEFSNKLFLIKNHLNYGFAEGNNNGIKYAIEMFNPEYVLLLNNDTIVDKNFLKEMVIYAEYNQNAGVIGPKIYYYDNPDVIQVTTTKLDLWTGRNFLVGDGEKDLGQFDNTKNTDYVSGACFFIRREVIDKVGYLDSNFKYYWEETDYCLLVKKNGYQCIYNPKSLIWHKSSKSTNKITGLLTFYMTRNMFMFMRKHSDRIHLLVFLLFFFGLKFWYVTLNFIIKKNYNDLSYYIKGVKDGLKYII